MNQWITIKRVDYIHEAYTIRAQLELEGFEVIILDELTTQVAPHFSPASGGARIQVGASEYEKAAVFLKELGHEIVEDADKKGVLREF
ncbi:MAG: hypothetical protein ACFHU9_00395 [Fluviicola sp.]